jgi:hypothetical protein
MRHFYALSLVFLAVSLPGLLGNSIVKRQAEFTTSTSTTVAPFSNNNALSSAPLDFGQLLGTLRSLFETAFTVVDRVLNTARTVAVPVIETVLVVGDAQARDPTRGTVQAGQDRIADDFVRAVPIAAPLRKVVDHFTGSAGGGPGFLKGMICGVICPIGADSELLTERCKQRDCTAAPPPKEEEVKESANFFDDGEDEDEIEEEGESIEEEETDDFASAFARALEEADEAEEADEDEEENDTSVI